MATITEALAEIKTITARKTKKREAIKQYLARQDAMRDPLDKDGGSVAFITRERQGIVDLDARLIRIRAAIAKANAETIITIGGTSRSLQDWLTWRREVAPGQRDFLTQLRNALGSVRQQANQKNLAVVGPGGTPAQATDVIVNLNEQELAADIETIEAVLGELDGQLSLKNATVTVAVE